MKIYKDFDLTRFNSYRIQSTCSVAYFPETEEDFISLFSVLKDKLYVIIGNGNNILLSKKKFNFPFVILNGNFNKIAVEGHLIEAESGATTLELSNEAMKHGLTNAEFLYDIPSSIGGAVVMNAGTKEGETKDILYKVRYLDLEEQVIKERYNQEIDLSYRNSYFQSNKKMIILKAWFMLQHGKVEEISKLMQESKNRRWSVQPREFPNCGSVFKRPPSKFVGPMIDQLGLRGFSIGGAQVSEKHSGFIVNVNNATGADILNLIRYVQCKVKQYFHISLEIEQRII